MDLWEDKITGRSCPLCGDQPKNSSEFHFIQELRATDLYLMHDQSFLGRVILIYRHHEAEMYNLPLEEQALVMQDVMQVAGALGKAFRPDKLNYVCLGDLNPHIHWHLVPRYKDGLLWGDNFMAHKVEPVYLKDEEYRALIEKIRKNL